MSDAVSTQQHLKIAQIRDNTVVLASGELRQVIETSSLNFSLKSSQEQNAIIGAYQGFINSLQFPIQIVMHSRRLDLAPYLVKMNKQLENQQNALIKIQTADYIDFIKRLITIANIMDKKFYLVVPHSTAVLVSSGGLFGLSRKGSVRVPEDKFQKAKTELDDRTRVALSGLSAIGLKAEILNTQQLVELYYGIYNAEEAPREHIAEKPGELTEALVTESPASQAEIEQSRAQTLRHSPAGEVGAPTAVSGQPAPAPQPTTVPQQPIAQPLPTQTQPIPTTATPPQPAAAQPATSTPTAPPITPPAQPVQMG